MTQPTVIAVLPKNRRESLRIALDQYQGSNLVDLRVVVESSGLATPTRKGVALRVEMLPALIGALCDAQAKARAMGLLESGI